MSKENKHKKDEEDDDELPGNWGAVHAAIWLIGIAILAWKGWWWPGILVLVALSGLFEAAARTYLKRQESAIVQTQQAVQQAQQRAEKLPAVCPQCGGPIGVDTVKWISENSAICPYCSAKL